MFHFFEGSFHLSSMELVLSYLDLSSSSNDNELLEIIVTHDWIAMQAAIVIEQRIVLSTILNNLMPTTRHVISHLKCIFIFIFIFLEIL